MPRGSLSHGTAARLTLRCVPPEQQSIDLREPFLVDDDTTSGTGPENIGPPSYSGLFTKKRQPPSAKKRPASAQAQLSRSVDATCLDTNEGQRLRGLVKPMQVARGRNANSPPPANVRAKPESPSPARRDASGLFRGPGSFVASPPRAPPARPSSAELRARDLGSDDDDGGKSLNIDFSPVLQALQASGFADPEWLYKPQHARRGFANPRPLARCRRVTLHATSRTPSPASCPAAAAADRAAAAAAAAAGQAKLAVTQENIKLRESEAASKAQLAGLDRQYAASLRAAEARAEQVALPACLSLTLHSSTVLVVLDQRVDLGVDQREFLAGEGRGDPEGAQGAPRAVGPRAAPPAQVHGQWEQRAGSTTTLFLTPRLDLHPPPSPHPESGGSAPAPRAAHNPEGGGRERQFQPFNRQKELARNKEEAEKLRREARAAREDSLARESVNCMAIAKLKVGAFA